MKGEKLTLTGQLGDVVRESAIAALSYVRSNAKRLDGDENFYDASEIHIHVPSAPYLRRTSAGITIMYGNNFITHRQTRQRSSAHWRITLTGNVLPIGGVKEKVLAAIRAGVKTIVLPLKTKMILKKSTRRSQQNSMRLYSKIDDAVMQY